jgi:hypothetical protein
MLSMLCGVALERFLPNPRLESGSYRLPAMTLDDPLLPSGIFMRSVVLEEVCR